MEIGRRAVIAGVNIDSKTYFKNTKDGMIGLFRAKIDNGEFKLDLTNTLQQWRVDLGHVIGERGEAHDHDLEGLQQGDDLDLENEFNLDFDEEWMENEEGLVAWDTCIEELKLIEAMNGLNVGDEGDSDDDGSGGIAPELELGMEMDQ